MKKVFSFFLFVGAGFLFMQSPASTGVLKSIKKKYVSETSKKCSHKIIGTIRDKESKKPIFEVTVELWSPNEHLATVLTDYKGEFTFSNVVCDERYDVVSYKEGYFGFAEVQTTPIKDQHLFLYLNPEAPEEYDDEIIVSNEMTIIDTQTNKVIENNEIFEDEDTNDLASVNNIPNLKPKKLSFAEIRERDRIKKEQEKKKRIEEEEKREIEKGISIPKNTRLSFAEREEYARLEKERRRKLRIQQEIENGIKAAHINTETKKLTFAQKRELARIGKKKMKEESFKKKNANQILKEKEEEEKRIAAIEKQKIEAKKEQQILLNNALKEAAKIRKERERIASSIALEKSRKENERINHLRQEEIAREKEREDRIAEAKKTAQKIRENKNTIAILELEKKNKKDGVQRKSLTERKKEKALALKLAKQKRIEKDRLAQIEKVNKKRIEEERITQIKQELDQKENKTTLFKQDSAISEERDEKIAKAQEIARQLRLEEEARVKKIRQEKIRKAKIAQAQKEELARKEQEELALENIQEQTEVERQQAAIDADRIRIQKEQDDRIAAAQATAKQLRLEQETKAKEARLNEIEATKIAQAQKEEPTLVKTEEQTESERKQAIVDADRIRIQKEQDDRIAAAQATAKKLRLEQETKAKKAHLNEIEATKIAQAQKEEPTLVKTEEQTESERKQAIVDADRIRIQKEQDDRIAAAQATAKQLRLEQETIAEQEKQEKLSVNRSGLEEDKPVTSTIENNIKERCSENIFGIIQNSEDSSPITEANVDIYFDGQNIETVQTNENGEFFIYNVDCQTNYTLICFKKDYKNIAKAAINTTDLPDQIVLLLEPNLEEEEKAIEKIVEINDDTVALIENKEPDAKIAKEEFTKNEKEFDKKTAVKVIPTQLEEVASIPKEVPDSQIDSISNLDANHLQPVVTEEIELNKEELIESVSKEERPDYIPDVESPKVVGKNIILNPIFFELDEWYLTLSARRELDKIIVLMYLNKTMIIEAGSHTDSRGPNQYNLELSEKRSQETVGYLVANGVDPDRVSGRGYGETIPVNRCVDGIKCTEREYLQNRRTEFVILKR